jgi:hypothetical protein
MCIQFYLKHIYLTDRNGAENVTEVQIHWNQGAVEAVAADRRARLAARCATRRSKPEGAADVIASSVLTFDDCVPKT